MCDCGSQHGIRQSTKVESSNLRSIATKKKLNGVSRLPKLENLGGKRVAHFLPFFAGGVPHFLPSSVELQGAAAAVFSALFYLPGRSCFLRPCQLMPLSTHRKYRAGKEGIKPQA